MDYQVIEATNGVFRICLDNLTVELITIAELDYALQNLNGDNYVNAYYNDTIGSSHIDMSFNLTQHYPDFEVNGVMSYNGDDIFIKGINYRPSLHDGYIDFGKDTARDDEVFRLNIEGFNVEDIRLVFAFRHKRYLFLNFLVDLNYCDRYNFTLVYDLKLHSFVECISENSVMYKGDFSKNVDYLYDKLFDKQLYKLSEMAYLVECEDF